MDLSGLLLRLSVTALPVVVAITLHEAAHGLVAYRCGDDSAWKLGRVTINPLRHIDLYGTILMPALLLLVSGGRFMFGYAKPVPVAFARLRRPRRDMVLVAAAGPAANLALALVSAALARGLALVPAPAGPVVAWIGANLYVSILVNLILAVFNMLPLPPLDGGRVAVGLLPEVLAVPLARVERHGILILVALVVLVPVVASASGHRLDLVAYVMDRPLSWLMTAMQWVSGVRYD